MFNAAWIAFKPGSSISDKPQSPKYVCRASEKQNTKWNIYRLNCLKRELFCTLPSVTTFITINFVLPKTESGNMCKDWTINKPFCVMSVLEYAKLFLVLTESIEKEMLIFIPKWTNLQLPQGKCWKQKQVSHW